VPTRNAVVVAGVGEPRSRGVAATADFHAAGRCVTQLDGATCWPFGVVVAELVGDGVDVGVGVPVGVGEGVGEWVGVAG